MALLIQNSSFPVEFFEKWALLIQIFAGDGFFLNYLM